MLFVLSLTVILSFQTSVGTLSLRNWQGIGFLGAPFWLDLACSAWCMLAPVCAPDNSTILLMFVFVCVLKKEKSEKRDFLNLFWFHGSFLHFKCSCRLWCSLLLSSKCACFWTIFVKIKKISGTTDRHTLTVTHSHSLTHSKISGGLYYVGQKSTFSFFCCLGKMWIEILNSAELLCC